MILLNEPWVAAGLGDEPEPPSESEPPPEPSPPRTRKVHAQLQHVVDSPLLSALGGDCFDFMTSDDECDDES